jgi:sec-independent protein translocase protein TatB
MLDISWGKLVIIGVVALLVIGPKELPAVLRQLGQMMAKVRRMAAEFQGQFQEAMREAEMADLKKQFDETTSSLQTAASSMTSALDPTSIKNDMEKLIQDPIKDPTKDPIKDPMQLDSSVATSTPATPPSDPTAPLATPATSTPEATPPSDPVALGTAPVSPENRAPTLDLPMPELPPPVDAKDFADASSSPSPPSKPAPKPEGDKAA